MANLDVFLYPFKTQFIDKELVTVYAVDCDQPENTGGMMAKEPCPHCGKSHIYKFTEEPFDYADDEVKRETSESYHCKCASCHQHFVAKIEMCY